MTDDQHAQGNTQAATHSSTLQSRYHQMFPSLAPQEIERLRQFGSIRRYADGERLSRTGEVGRGMFVIISGHVAITQRDGLGHVTPIVDQGPGQFLAEVGTLSGRAALVDGHAEGDVEALMITPENLRRLLIAEAELGERIVRALILRRVGLIESHASGPVLIGPPTSSDVIRLETFLRRNGHPHHLLDPATDPEAAELIARYGPGDAELPLVINPDGAVLRNPKNAELARALGMVAQSDGAKLYDVAVVGSGPAGLATAVYAASEGLSVVVLDSGAYGGQAGASARIENYLGFPTGISGQALAGRAFVQAQKFGAEIIIPVDVKSLDCSRTDGALALNVGDGGRIRARSLVIATGARYRRPAIEGLEAFEGRGVWYWASPIEARLCSGEDVFLVGGGNSAGQAAVFLSAHAAKVTILIRGDGLAHSMSRYLIDRIAAAPNIDVLTHSEIVALSGAPQHGLEKVRWRNRRNGAETTSAIRNVFLFAGADPATAWLVDCGIELDKAGFVITGAKRCELAAEAAVNALESSIPGIFAVGDVRAGSIKRVGAAIGEGAQVVAALHSFLARQSRPHAWLPRASRRMTARSRLAVGPQRSSDGVAGRWRPRDLAVWFEKEDALAWPSAAKKTEGTAMKVLYWVYTASWAFLTSALMSLAQPALAQQAKPGIERMYVLYCGDIALNDASSFTPGASGPGHLSVTCYLIKHARGWVLYDTGVGDHIISMPNGQKSQAGVWTVKKTLESQLAELGLKPSDIDFVALSHSHGDHVGNLNLFSQSTLVVQKAEFEWKPPVGVSPFKPGMKAITPEGDHDLFGDGSVVLIATHGHSPGHQNLLVRLPKTGAVMLTGDSVHTKANWDSGRVPQRNFNVPQSLAALQRMRDVLKEANAVLWIGHEPSEVPQRRYAPASYD